MNNSNDSSAFLNDHVNTALANLLDETPKEKLVSFLLNRAGQDKYFENELLTSFGKPDRKTESTFLKEFIKTTLQKNSRRGYIDWRGCDSICMDFDDMLNRAKTRLTEDAYMLAFDVSLNILLACVKLVSTADSSSGALNMTMDTSLEILEQSCQLIEKYGSVKEKKETFESLLRQSKSNIFDGWGEWNYVLLRDSVLFIDEKNVKKLYETLDILLEKYSKEKYMSHCLTDDKLTRLAAIRKVEGDTAADEYMMQNVDIDEFRKIAIEDATRKGNYELAEKLCLEKIHDTEPPKFFGRLPQWWYLLHKVYKKSGNRAEQTKTAKFIFMKGDASFYKILKNIYTEDDVWEAQYIPLLESMINGLPAHLYMPILQDEEEWSLLFDEVKLMPKSIFTYGKALAAHYPEEIYAIYKSEIEKEAHNAGDRREYKQVCSLIKQLFEAGGESLAISITESFKDIYKKRPSMVDELTLLQKKLTKMK